MTWLNTMIKQCFLKCSEKKKLSNKIAEMLVALSISLK